MLIELPNKHIIVYTDLLKIEAQGLSENILGNEINVFNKSFSISDIQANDCLDIADALVYKSKLIHFRYIHKNIVNTAVWNNELFLEESSSNLGKIKIHIPNRLKKLKDVDTIKLALESSSNIRYVGISRDQINLPYIEISLNTFKMAKDVY